MQIVNFSIDKFSKSNYIIITVCGAQTREIKGRDSQTKKPVQRRKYTDDKQGSTLDCMSKMRRQDVDGPGGYHIDKLSGILQEVQKRINYNVGAKEPSS